MTSTLTIVGICGSLRKGSFNMALLKAAQASAPDGVTLTILNIGDLPLYNQDNEDPVPEVVQAFKKAIEAADAVLIATPEYNYSIPGVLKNAIDWLSRPYGQNSLNDKPVAIMGASVGMGASGRAQYHLRQCFVFLNGHVLNQPEVLVPMAQDKIDAQGNITDAKTKEKVTEIVDALAQWTRRLR